MTTMAIGMTVHKRMLPPSLSTQLYVGRTQQGPARPANKTLSGLRRRAHRGLYGLRHQLIEDLRVVDRDLAEHLAVQQVTGHFQPVDEQAVARAAHPARGRDTRDPQGSHVALAVAPIAIGIRPRADERVL